MRWVISVINEVGYLIQRFLGILGPDDVIKTWKLDISSLGWSYEMVDHSLKWISPKEYFRLIKKQFESEAKTLLSMMLFLGLMMSQNRQMGVF